MHYPDGFEEMDREQLKEAFLDDNPNRWGIKDEKRHMMITVLWNRTNMISAMITGPAAVADSAERKMRTSLNKSSYKCGGFERKKISGRNANGFTYEYVLEGAAQIGEVLVFQNVNCFYMLYAYALKKNQKAARVVIDVIENSISFGKMIRRAKGRAAAALLPNLTTRRRPSLRSAAASVQVSRWPDFSTSARGSSRRSL